MVNRNVVLLIGLLILTCGVILSVVGLRQMAGPGVPPSAPVAPPQTILVAARPIPAGTLLRLEDMAWSAVPGAEVVAADIVQGTANETDFIGAVAVRPFSEQEPLVASALVKPGDRDFLIAALRPGYRAISISVDATQSVSGLMLPGNRVDVVLTQNFNLPNGGDPTHRSVAETVLQDLRVIAVDQQVNPNATPPQAAVGASPDGSLPKTVTLEVTQQQAETLLVADQLGKLQLVLRGRPASEPASEELATVPPTWAFDVSPALGELATAAPAPEKGQVAIEVLHGSTIERRCLTNNGLVACP
jgi:pilus assembly protein CpaB